MARSKEGTGQEGEGKWVHFGRGLTKGGYFMDIFAP